MMYLSAAKQIMAHKWWGCGVEGGGYKIYIVNEKRNCPPISWQSKRLQRVIKNAISAETNEEVDYA